MTCIKKATKRFLLDKHVTDQDVALLAALDNLKGVFDFEMAVISLKLACERPANGDYTYWITNVNIGQPHSIAEASTYQGVGMFIESRKADYKAVFGSSSSYSGIISVLASSRSLDLAQNGFMLMSAEFARPFVDVGNSVISWGGNWKGLKDFMHMEYVEKNRFNDK